MARAVQSEWTIDMNLATTNTTLPIFEDIEHSFITFHKSPYKSYGVFLLCCKNLLILGWIVYSIWIKIVKIFIFQDIRRNNMKSTKVAETREGWEEGNAPTRFVFPFTDAPTYTCVLRRLTIDIDRRSFCCSIRPDTRRSPRPFCLDSPSGRHTISLEPWPEGTPRMYFADRFSARRSRRRSCQSRRKTHFFLRTCRFCNGSWTRRILEIIKHARISKSVATYLFGVWARDPMVTISKYIDGK